jgi:AbiV family abortive infection protein
MQKKGWLRRYAGDFKGREPLDKLGPWALAALENAGELLLDANALYKARRYSRAASMSNFALEEMGKAVIIVSLISELTLGSKPEWDWYERAVTGHADKLALISRAVAFGAEGPESEIERSLEVAIQESKRPLRERSLYVDFVAGKVLSPSHIFDRRVARSYLDVGFLSMRHTVDAIARLSGNIEDLVRLAPVERAEIEELADTFVEGQEDLRGQIAAALAQLSKEQSVEGRV